ILFTFFSRHSAKSVSIDLIRTANMKHSKKIQQATFSLPLLVLSGCKSIPSYSGDYDNYTDKDEGTPLDQSKDQDICIRSTSTFFTLGTPAFIERAGSLYADQLFINDPLSQFSSRQNLLQHFQGMNKRVSNVNVKLLNTSYYQDSAYVHW